MTRLRGSGLALSPYDRSVTAVRGGPTPTDTPALSCRVHHTSRSRPPSPISSNPIGSALPYSDCVNVISLDAEFQTHPRPLERPNVDRPLQHGSLERNITSSTLEVHITQMNRMGRTRFYVGRGASSRLFGGPKFDSRRSHSGLLNMENVSEVAIGRQTFSNPASTTIAFNRLTFLVTPNDDERLHTRFHIVANKTDHISGTLPTATFARKLRKQMEGGVFLYCTVYKLHASKSSRVGVVSCLRRITGQGYVIPSLQHTPLPSLTWSTLSDGVESGEIWAALNIEVLRADAGEAMETGDPREKPANSVAFSSTFPHVRKSESRTLFALLGGASVLAAEPPRPQYSAIPCHVLLSILSILHCCTGMRQDNDLLSNGIRAASFAKEAVKTFTEDGDKVMSIDLNHNFTSYLKNRGRILKFTIPELIELLKPVMYYLTNSNPDGGGLFGHWFGHSSSTGGVTVVNHTSNASSQSDETIGALRVLRAVRQGHIPPPLTLAACIIYLVL
ncbi:hypothetical protein PR048_007766 [Dryococelus australis]|uniref:Uncharacterized protein n=1 Tax=Dryococelus australis TaxID=614101 RepID=A0ABQ9HW19_9NEOP|nr:hypothetical protein PR048_007766 [Dryococelus australis]